MLTPDPSLVSVVFMEPYAWSRSGVWYRKRPLPGVTLTPTRETSAEKPFEISDWLQESAEKAVKKKSCTMIETTQRVRTREGEEGKIS